MFSFRGAYDGKMEFFPGRVVENVWEHKDDLVDVPPDDSDVTDPIVDWTNEGEPPEFSRQQDESD